MWQAFELDPKVKLGDLITSLSFALALAGFLYTWTKDRRFKTKEYADRVRAAAALTLAKIDRCESLFLSLFFVLQPIITEADEFIVREKDLVRCRDLFWKQANGARLLVLNSFRDEEIELAYAPLLPFRADIYNIFRESIGLAQRAEDRLFWSLQDDCQTSISNLDTQRDFKSARLGNELREVLGRHLATYSKELDEVFKYVRGFLRGVIAAKDREIIARAATEPAPRRSAATGAETEGDAVDTPPQTPASTYDLGVYRFGALTFMHDEAGRSAEPCKPFVTATHQKLDSKDLASRKTRPS